MCRKYSSGLKGPPLTLTVDAGTAWSCPDGRSGCFNITFDGATKSVAQHVIDLSDGVVLMVRVQSYRMCTTGPSDARTAGVIAWYYFMYRQRYAMTLFFLFVFRPTYLASPSYHWIPRCTALV